MSEPISRRDFLKLATVGLASGAIIGARLRSLIRDAGSSNSTPERGLPEPNKSPEPLPLTPETIDGVEVYGLNEKLSSEEDVRRFYSYLDRQFEEKKGVKITDKRSQRKELLAPNERYLEVVVRKSAYDSFLQKKKETGVSFPEWIRMHVDVLNRCMDNAKPPAEAHAVLRRILVIEDEMPKSFWDEDAYKKGKGYALDAAWTRFNEGFPIDTDVSWAVADDYREIGGSYFWTFDHVNGKTVFHSLSLTTIELPDRNDSLAGKDGIKLDIGLTHEWIHRLLNLPDEYAQDLRDDTQRFKRFLMGTGSFHEPYFSPYLSCLMRNNIKLRARNYYYDNRGEVCFNDRPETIQVDVEIGKRVGRDFRIDLRNIDFVEGSRYGREIVSGKPDQVSNGTSIRFGKDLLKSQNNSWVLKVSGKNLSRELYLPPSMFNMSKLAGLNSATYSITFTDYDDPTKTTQEIKLVDDSDIDKFLKLKTEEDDLPYAKMKVEGTGTWFVWFLRHD